MDTETLSEDIRRYFLLVWHWAWLLVIAFLLAGIAAYVFSVRTTPVYQATTVLLVNEAPTTKTTDYASVLTSQRLALTYAELITTGPVFEKVIAELQLSMTPEELGSRVKATLLRDTQLIDVRIEDTDPKRAAEIANTLARVFAEQNLAIQTDRYAGSKASLQAQLDQIEQQIEIATTAMDGLGMTAADDNERERLQTALGQYRQMYASLLASFEQVRVAESSSISAVLQIEEAVTPTHPVRPRILFNTVVAAMLGLVFAMIIVVLVEILDDTLSPDSVTRELGLPVLGLITHHQIDSSRPVVAMHPRSPVSEAFRSLRTNIQFASVDKPLRSLLVTSPSPEDGKSTVIANLSVTLAQGGRKVVVVDADLRRPQVHKKLALANRLGISSIFVQPRVALDGTVQDTQYTNLYALTSGNLPPNPSELLGSEKMNEILSLLGERFDLVLVDTPPVMAVTDATALSTRVDGVLLVVRPGVTKLAVCRQAVEQLRRVNANILGVVLNDVEMTRSRYKYGNYKGYYYSYHKYYGNEKETAAVKE